MENYGTESAPYWKFKGGETYVVSFPVGMAADDVVALARPRIEYANPMASEHIIGWKAMPADAATQWEADQLEFDGRVDSLSPRLAVG